MISIVALANTFITSHNYYFFVVVRTIKIQSPSNFEVHNTVYLPIITMLRITSPGLIYILVASLRAQTSALVDSG